MLKAIMIGRLTKEPELRMTTAGKSVCNFDLAINLKDDRAVYVRVTAWEKNAENCHRNLHKGSLVSVTGEPGADAYIGKDGKAKGSLRVTAKEVEFLSDWGNRRSDADDSGLEYKVEEMADINPDDIPF